MVNFHDPARLALDFLAVVKLWHTVDGLYIWEFFTTLGYEWDVFRGHRPYLWTIWVYSLTRVATLLAVIVNMIGFDSTSPINCQAWVTSELFFAYAAISGASLLIVLRVIAIWERNIIILVITTGIWLTNLGFLIHSIALLRSSWVPALGTCAVLRSDTSKYNIIVTLSTDIILLLIMLGGLLRMRLQGGDFRLARLLWTQGVVWIVLATVAEVPPTVLILLNLSDPWNLMFQTPALITVSIAATRMYRSLIDLSATDRSLHGGSSGAQTFAASDTKLIFTGPIPLSRMEDGHSSLCHKPHRDEFGVNGDAESGTDK